MSTRRSKRRSSVAASAAISEQAPGGGSANSATNSGNASSTASSRTTSSKSRTRTPRPTTELLGKRISVTWPKDKTTYPARVIDYNEKKKIHRVIYDIDNSIEELNLARRKYTAIAPEGDEANEKCIIGKKIILEVAVNDEVEDDDAPKDDYTCMVLRKTCDVEDEEEEEEGEGEGGDDEEKKESDETSVMVDVIYLANEYITSVDLSKHKFIILDMQSGEKVREVAEGHSSLFVEIECTETAGESVEVEEKKEELAVEPDTTTSETNATPIARGPTAETTREKPETEIETETEKPTAPVPANGEAGNGDGEEDGLMDDDPPLAAETTANPKASKKALEQIIIDDDSEEDIEEPKKTEAAKETKMDDAESKALSAPQSNPKIATEEVIGSAMPEEGKTERFKKGYVENSNVVETEKPDEAMDIVPAIEEGPKTVKEACAVLGTTDETVIDGGNELEKMADAAPEPGASDAVKETSKPAADVVNPEVNSAQKQQPLTAENIKILEGSTQNGVAAKKVAEVDDDVKTLSDADNEQWIASSSITLPDPESVVKKFVGIKTSSEKERVAFVEAHLSSGNHFLEFHDKEGGSTQLVLTTENCRLLSEEEIEKLGGKQAGPGITPGPATASNKRKNVNGKESSNKRRRANSDMASPKPKPKPKAIRLPKLPPPGSEIVGKVITIEWPGNTELYKGLVVGCQFGPEKTLHKIFYVEDESMETVDLSVRSWAHGNKEEVPWNSSGLVGKRLYVYWEGEYVEDDVQKRAEEKFKSKKTKVPYEAYVVKFLGPHKYRLLYTLDDNLENRNLNDDDADWNVVDAGVTEVDDLPIVSWTGPLEEE